MIQKRTVVWLASYPKSGNTWLRAFLCNLIADADRPISINDINKFSCYAADYNFYAPFTDKDAIALTPEDLALVRPRVHRAIANLSPERVLVKTHSFLGEICEVPTITPDVTAAAIYIVRNPLDVCPSLAHHVSVSIDEAINLLSTDNAKIGKAPAQVQEVVGSWSTNVQSWSAINHPDFKVVRFEDMLGDTLRTFRDLSHFLGIQASESTLQKAIKFSSFEELRRQEDALGFSEQVPNAKPFFRAGQKDRWKSSLSKKQIVRLVSAHRQQMERFHYVPEGY